MTNVNARGTFPPIVLTTAAVRRAVSAVLLALFITAVPSGCATPGPTPLTYSVRRIAPQEVPGILERARMAVEADGFGVAELNPAEGFLVSRLLAIDSAVAGERTWRDRRATRKLATVRVIRGEDELNVFCKVEIQKQATETYRFFHQERSRSDVPDETAIDRDAATTTEQNTVWETIYRDKTAERRILQKIVE